MAIIKSISKELLRDTAARTGFDQRMIVKDYYVTALLYVLKDIRGMFFKGGTALQKIFLKYTRLSEDADFTVMGDINQIQQEIREKVNQSGLFEAMAKDKDVDDFLRLLVHYRDPFGEPGTVCIDLNKRAKVLLEPEVHPVPHFFPESIPEFTIRTLNLAELVAEKVVAAMRRNKPRDHFDLYQIIQHGIPIDLRLVERKCETSQQTFAIADIFAKAKKLKNRWDQSMIPLLREPVPFPVVMQTLAQHFSYAAEKEKRKNVREIHEMGNEEGGD